MTEPRTQATCTEQFDKVLNLASEMLATETYLNTNINSKPTLTLLDPTKINYNVE